MKIAIIYTELEWSEKTFNEYLNKLGHQSKLFEISLTNINDLLDFKPDLVLNRVYASKVGVKTKLIGKVLMILHTLEKNGIHCINSSDASCYDYSKKLAADRMKQTSTPTPETLFINELTNDSKEFITSFIENHGFPIILKPNTGGRGTRLHLLSSFEEIYTTLEKVFSLEERKLYNNGYIIQEFIKPVRNHDCRIAIINGEFAFSYARSLVSFNGESPWIASVANGSTMFEYLPSEEEINLAKKATKVLGANFNEVDMTFSNDGPVIIENNLTPGYDSEDGPEEIYRLKKAAEIMVKEEKLCKSVLQ